VIVPGQGLPNPSTSFQVDADLVGNYYRHLDQQDRSRYTDEDLRERVNTHVRVGGTRAARTSAVAVVPTATETLIYVVTDDMPFLVDSVTNAVLRHASRLRLVLHPTFVAHRATDDSRLTALLPVPASSPLSSGDTAALPSLGALTTPEGEQPRIESWMFLEVDQPLGEDSAAELEQSLLSVLGDVRHAVADWQPMRDAALRAADDLAAGVPSLPASETDEAAAMLRWLDDDHFTFLGYREYLLEDRGDVDVLVPVDASGLGLMRRAEGTARELTGVRGQRAREARTLVLTTANRRSTVHRDQYLDYIGVKTFDADGVVIGERRFIGLFTSSAVSDPVRSVPVIRRKVDQVLAGAGFALDSHSGKDLLAILESFPREELFQTDPDSLAATVDGIMHLQDHRATRVFLRGDTYGRFVSALVFVPRDRWSTPVRLRVEEELSTTFDAVSMDFDLRMGDSALVRAYYRIRLRDEVAAHDVDQAGLEQRVARAVRSWSEGMEQAFVASSGAEAAVQLTYRWAEAFPPAYRVVYEVEDALEDVVRLDALADEGTEGIDLVISEAGSQQARLKLYLREAQPLSSILPLLSALGLEVSEEHPYTVTPADGDPLYLYDLTVQVPHDVDTAAVESGVRDAYRAVSAGRAESDPLQHLVTTQGLGWREVTMLRAYVKYLRQLGVATTVSFVARTLGRYPEVTAALIERFHAGFDPARGDDADARTEAVDRARGAVLNGLDQVATLDADRLLRRLLQLMDATLRTNYYLASPRLAFKFSTRDIEDAPLPRPKYEIWVYSPRVEGVHLRFGDVARGGLRWSDRGEDFRTEILGLVKAQTVKNAVIVPTGAKGGFYAKQLPDPAQDREGWLAEGRASYTEFVTALLQITDNLVHTPDGTQEVRPPEQVVRHDGDDTYLVVAADKGTAAFSDLANSIAAERGFWLGDAFASGGSVGYDHKAMGITARGAWKSVERHFFELDVDVATEDFTMVGIGDMSGDVFGNGLLRTPHAKLVAAFDHRHVFVDPDPDAATSFRERRRLFDLPRSSWDDYDRSLISEGGGVFPRTAKSVPVSAQMRRVLGLGDDVDRLSPPDLIQAVLRAPVDLLYNGGVGTYIKAEAESDAEVGDRSNDQIRVNGSELRVRVIGEGGNLGMTQRGRIEAARAGIIVNTDAIDNSAGVDCSDHEVNIKILVDALVRSGKLAAADRADLLHSYTDAVGDLVLEDNFAQNVLLLNERHEPESLLPAQERLLTFLEREADLDRDLEFLPSTAELERRRAGGEGLSGPEWSVVVAYAKIQLADALAASDLPQEESTGQILDDYFPRGLVEAYPDAPAAHPLRKEIIATQVANRMVNVGGATYAFAVMEELSVTEAEVAKAFLAVTRIFDMDALLEQLHALPASFPNEHWTRVHRDQRRLLERATRWYLENVDPETSVEEAVARYAQPVQSLVARLNEFVTGADAERERAWVEASIGWGLSEPTARAWATQFESFALLDVVRVALNHGWDPDLVAGVYFSVYSRFDVDTLLEHITTLPRTDRWQTLARAALREDLYSTTAEITTAVIADTDDDEPAATRLSTWSGRQQDKLRRVSATFDEVVGAARLDMAALSVALRLLRSIVRR
jgi:glutamate dehydrogenase